MDPEINELQIKQERMRTRWTSSLDKIFADIVVEQIQQGNRPNNVFDKKTWNHIRDEFNQQTNLNFNNNQLRKHLDVLRTRYNNLKSAVDQSDPVDDACYIGFDLWEDIGIQNKPAEATKVKECPIYDQLCMIFADSGADGKYARSSHYEELDTPAAIDSSLPESGNSHPKTPLSLPSGLEDSALPPSMSGITSGKKRKLPPEMSSISEQGCKDLEVIGLMAKAMSEMVAASKVCTSSVPSVDRRFTISKCIKAMDQIEGMDDTLYYGALDLFDHPDMRETFLSLKSNMLRLTWLQRNCVNTSFFC